MLSLPLFAAGALLFFLAVQQGVHEAVDRLMESVELGALTVEEPLEPVDLLGADIGVPTGLPRQRLQQQYVIEPEAGGDTAKVLDPGEGLLSLPTRHCRLVHARHFGHLDLAEIEGLTRGEEHLPDGVLGRHTEQRKTEATYRAHFRTLGDFGLGSLTRLCA